MSLTLAPLCVPETDTVKPVKARVSWPPMREVTVLVTAVVNAVELQRLLDQPVQEPLPEAVLQLYPSTTAVAN